jgi:hypothetical protein
MAAQASRMCCASWKFRRSRRRFADRVEIEVFRFSAQTRSQCYPASHRILGLMILESGALDGRRAMRATQLDADQDAKQNPVG